MPKYVVNDGYTFGRGDQPDKQKVSGDVITLAEAEATPLLGSVLSTYVAPKKPRTTKKAPVTTEKAND